MELKEGLGYSAEDIRSELGEDRFAQFLTWIKGQTVAVSKKGVGLVYPWDYEAFLKGEPVYD